MTIPATVAPSPAARKAIGALLSGIPVPNEPVQTAQASARMMPGVDPWLYAHEEGLLPPLAHDAQALFADQEREWLGLGTTGGVAVSALWGGKYVTPTLPDANHVTVRPHLTIATTHPDASVRKLARLQASELVEVVQDMTVCKPGASFTNPRGLAHALDALLDWTAVAPHDVEAMKSAVVVLGKVEGGHSTSKPEPHFTLHASKADHGERLVCSWMSGGRLARTVAIMGQRAGGYGKVPSLDALMERGLACLQYSAAHGQRLTGLIGRFVDDYIPTPWLKPGTETAYGAMNRWHYPAVVELARAGVPGAREFLDGPVRVAWEADDQMKPSRWLVGLGAQAAQAASIAIATAPAFGWRA